MTRPEPRHRLLIDALPAPREGGADGRSRIEIAGDEAHHAVRVKRLRVSEVVELLDGRGRVQPARVGEISGSRQHPVLIVEPTSGARLVEPVRPRVEVCSPAPRGPRLDDMIDQLSQVGASAWRPLLCARAETKPGSIRADKLTRRARESMKQCGRAWVLGIGQPIAFGDAMGDESFEVILADASGNSEPRALARAVMDAQPSDATIRILIGPEGGWTDDELDHAHNADARIARFGPHTMRLETACVVAAGVVLSNSSEPRA